MKNGKNMKRKARVALALALCAALAVMLTACGGSGSSASAEPAKLNFSDAVNDIEALDGKAVTLTGYMATLSPLSGDYIYLMNMPYQSCPFCIPNTTQLANTMAVYAAKGNSFDYTDRPVRISGTMEVGDFTDDYGYQYGYRIKDASYEVVDLSDVSEDYALYQALAEDGVIADIYAMFDYLHFVCQWTEYQSTGVDESGNEISYYLYPGDVSGYLESDSAYGYKTQASEDYFPTLVERVKSVSADGLTELVDVLDAAQAAEKYAREQLDGGKYTYDEATDKFTLDEDAQLYQNYSDVYLKFDEWLAKYQL